MDQARPGAECFPEPHEPDFARPLHAADRIDWLRRSGKGRAVALRRFLNQNLSALPPECSASLCGRFGPTWDKAAYFEMIVGRFLQLAGATLTYEPLGAGGRRVDFEGVFPGGTVFVEATSPDYNWEGVTKVRHQEPLLDIIAAEAPDGWWVMVDDLPDHRPDDSRRGFRRAVRELMKNIPDVASAGDGLDVATVLPNGRLSMHLRPGRPEDTDPVAMSPGATLLENSWDRIISSVRGKRRQARAFHELGPVLLALDSSWYTDEDDFDLALFGGTYSSLSPNGQEQASSFHATGVFATQLQAEFAGALVFRDLGFCAGP